MSYAIGCGGRARPPPPPGTRSAENTLKRELGRRALSEAADSSGDDPLAAAPPLAALAALCALAAVLVTHVVVRLLPDAVRHADVLGLVRSGELLRNTAALAAMLSLGFVLVDLLRRTDWAPPSRRLIVASFGGLFLPSTLIALVLPHARISMMVVMMGIGAGTVLAALLALTAVRFRAPAVLRVGLFALGMAILLAFIALVLRISVLGTRTASGQETVRQVGEVLHVGSLLAAGWALAPLPPRSLRDRLAGLAGLAVAAAVGLALGLAPARLGPDFDGFFYGVQRLSLWLETAPGAYGLLLGPAAGLAVAAALGGDASRRQGGLGLLLVLAAGFAPRSLVAVLLLALATGLLARAALALAERAARAAEPAQDAARSRGNGRVPVAPPASDDGLSEDAPPPPESA